MTSECPGAEIFQVCCAEPTPRPGTSAKRCTASVVVREQLRHLLIELCKLVFDEAEFVERQLHQPPIDWMKIRARPEGVAQLIGRRPQA